MFKDKVNGGFRKWSIGLGENSEEIIVVFGEEPIYGQISLRDASIKELRDIGEMFLAAACKAEQAVEKVKETSKKY